MVNEIEQALIEELKDPEFAKLYGSERARSVIGLLLFHARQKAGLTQKEVSEKLGVRQPYIAQLESGEANPTIGMIGKLLARFGLELVADVESLSPQEKPAQCGVYNTNIANLVGNIRTADYAIGAGEAQRVNTSPLNLSSTADIKLTV